MAVELREIDDHELVTQYGRALPGEPTFHRAPRSVDRGALSVIVGRVSKDGCFYLFECIAGRMLSGSFWVYSHIQSSELARLDDAEGAAFEEVVRDLQISRPVTFAVDFKDAGIIASVEVWEGPDGFGAALSELQDRVQEYVQGIVRTRDELTDLKSSPAWERMVASAR